MQGHLECESAELPYSHQHPRASLLLHTISSAPVCLIGAFHTPFDLDKTIDYGWCELEDTSRASKGSIGHAPFYLRCLAEMIDLMHHYDLYGPYSANSCAVDGNLELINAGVILSFWGCELKENRNGIGPVKILDAPLAFLSSDGARCCSRACWLFCEGLGFRV